MIVDVVQRTEGVLKEKPVEVLFIAFGESATRIQVRWWIDSYTETAQMFDRVHSVIYRMLDEYNIELPFTTYTMNLNLTAESQLRLSQLLRKDPE